MISEGSADCDIAVVGSGFGGSLMAMIACRLGYRVMLLERGTHPRFAIGESASPLAGILIEQLADRYGLPRVRPLSAFGTWRRSYPDVVCGLKRGFTYFRHDADQPYRSASDRSNQLLVAASPNDELSDTHWLRADVDHFLMREAVALGVDYVDEVRLDSMTRVGDRWMLSGDRRGRSLSVRAGLVIDASGPHGFVSRALKIGNAGFRGYPATQALFSHFRGVARCDGMREFVAPHEVTAPLKGAPYEVTAPLKEAPYEVMASLKGVPYEKDQPPYPIDDAALHHVFDGGWMWVLRFGNGVTSAGIAVTSDLARNLRLSDGEPAWRRFLARYPSIAAQFAQAQATREFTWMPQLAWRVDQAAGDRWVMLPSAAAFIDPLFSTGIPLTLLGIERIARVLERRSEAHGQAPLEGVPYESLLQDYESGFQDYAAITLADADHTARFIAGCYTAFPRFEQFAAYSMFYFAAASHAEMSRRLGVAAPGGGFLGSGSPSFAAALNDLSPAVRQWDDRYASDAAAAIAPLNIAGLCDPRRRNWYPVDFEDAIRAAARLGVSAERVAAVCAG